MLAWEMGGDPVGLEWAERERERLERGREQLILAASTTATAAASGVWAKNSPYHQNS